MTEQRLRSPYAAFGAEQFGAWVLICNPRVFDPTDIIGAEYLETGWSVNPRVEARTALMEPGQRVLLWVTGGSDMFERGFWGAGFLTSGALIDDFEYSDGWLIERDREQEVFVEFEMDMFQEPVGTAMLSADRVLAEVEPLRAPQVTPAFLTLSELELLNELMEVPYEDLLVDPLPQNWRRIEKKEAPNFEHRRRTENIAMHVVTEYYESLGYVADDISRQRLGWDISFATELGDKKNVEVKGLTQSRPVVNLTRNELRKARSNPHWELIIVTDEHDGANRLVRFYSREKVLAVKSQKRFRHHRKAILLDFMGVEPDLEIQP